MFFETSSNILRTV